MAQFSDIVFVGYECPTPTLRLGSRTISKGLLQYNLALACSDIKEHKDKRRIVTYMDLDSVSIGNRGFKADESIVKLGRNWLSWIKGIMPTGIGVVTRCFPLLYMAYHDCDRYRLRFLLDKFHRYDICFMVPFVMIHSRELEELVGPEVLTQFWNKAYAFNPQLLDRYHYFISKLDLNIVEPLEGTMNCISYKGGEVLTSVVMIDKNKLVQYNKEKHTVIVKDGVSIVNYKNQLYFNGVMSPFIRDHPFTYIMKQLRDKKLVKKLDELAIMHAVNLIWYGRIYDDVKTFIRKHKITIPDTVITRTRSPYTFASGYLLPYLSSESYKTGDELVTVYRGTDYDVVMGQIRPKADDHYIDLRPYDAEGIIHVDLKNFIVNFHCGL